MSSSSSARRYRDHPSHGYRLNRDYHPCHPRLLRFWRSTCRRRLRRHHCRSGHGRNAYKKARPEEATAQIAAFKPKELQPAELLSTESYKPGEMIEYQPDKLKPVRMAEVLEIVS